MAQMGSCSKYKKLALRMRFFTLTDGEFIFPCIPVCYHAVLCRTGLSHSVVQLLALLSFIKGCTIQKPCVQAGEKNHWKGFTV